MPRQDLLALDRVVTLTVEAEGEFVSGGHYVEGATTVTKTWARRRQSSGDLVLDAGGTRFDTPGTFYRVRWRRDLSIAQANNVQVEDHDMGKTFDAISILDQDRRRRFIDVKVAGST